MSGSRRRIENYRFGSITIDGATYREDLIICPDRIVTNWQRREGHSLVPEDLREVLEPKPDVLIIGRGAYGALKIPESTRAWLAERNIQLIDLVTLKACDRYRELADKGGVIAGLHLTC